MNSNAVDLWHRVTSQEALQAAWMKVASNEGSAGGDGVSLREFGADQFAQITQLRAELLGGTYRTGPFRKVSIPKKKPGYRILTIPSIRDRVLHTSISSALTPIMEPLFEDGSFAYRPGRGVTHAVERIEKWRRRGFDIVIEADIVSYFDNIDQEILLDKLRFILAPLDGSAPLLTLIEQLLLEQGRALGTPGTGLVQGSPMSPLLANLYLDALDEEIEEQGVKIVRFADDFVILCKSHKKAQKVLQYCVAVLNEHNLHLHEDGTRIVSFDKGFDFIGYLFLRTLALKEKGDPAHKQKAKPVKSSVTDEGIIELDDEGSRFDPGNRVLYVLDGRHVLTRRNKSFSVRRDDDSELIAIPHKRVGRIEVGPHVDFARGPLDLGLETNTEIAFVDGFGQTRGMISHRVARKAGIHFAQAKCVRQIELRTELARKMVDARIRNQRAQLSRLNRKREDEHVSVALDAMHRTLRKVSHAQSVEELRGHEGAAGAIYWPALGRLIDGRDTLPFRRTRPARDSYNAVINYMTAILERDIRASIQTAGLHPGFGILHGTRDDHDGLVYDLMEPFRAPLTEGLPIYLFNARRLRPEMFEDDKAESEITIDAAGREAIIREYENAVAKRIRKPDSPQKLGWRAMMLYQSRSLVHAVKSLDPKLFRPYLMQV